MQEPTFEWHEDYFRLFISHQSADAALARALRDELEFWGVHGFVAHEDIEPGAGWQRVIEESLRTCDGLVALMSDTFHSSFWVDQEIGFALGRQVPVIPVRLQTLNPYGFIGAVQALPAGPADTRTQRVVSALQRGGTRPSAILDRAFASRYSLSESFADTKRNLPLLQSIRAWTPSVDAKLSYALLANNQVADEWGAPGQIAERRTAHNTNLQSVPGYASRVHASEEAAHQPNEVGAWPRSWGAPIVTVQGFTLDQAEADELQGTASFEVHGAGWSDMKCSSSGLVSVPPESVIPDDSGRFDWRVRGAMEELGEWDAFAFQLSVHFQWRGVERRQTFTFPAIQRTGSSSVRLTNQSSVEFA